MISHTSSRRPSASTGAWATSIGSAAAPARTRANLATLLWSCATMFLAFCGPMPGNRFRQLRDGQGERARRDHRPDILHGDELLEELLVEVRREADQHGARLITGRVVVDDQFELAPLLTRSGGDVLDLAEGDRRQEHLIAEAATLENHAVLELAPQPSGERRDHVNRPPRRENPVIASASASATWDGVGRASSFRSRRTECCT